MQTYATGTNPPAKHLARNSLADALKDSFLTAPRKIVDMPGHPPPTLERRHGDALIHLRHMVKNGQLDGPQGQDTSVASQFCSLAF